MMIRDVVIMVSRYMFSWVMLLAKTFLCQFSMCSHSMNKFDEVFWAFGGYIR